MKVTNDAVAKLKALINNPKFADDVVKFGNGNNAAGTRIRGVMQELKKLAQEVRQDIQDIRAQRSK